MRKCWAHCPEVRPSFRVLKEQLINVSQGLLNDWLSLLRCLRFSSPSSAGSGRSISSSTTASIQVQAPRSPFLERTSLTASSHPASSNNSSSYNSATLPASHRVRSNASLPSAAELIQLSSTLCRATTKKRGSRDSSREHDKMIVATSEAGKIAQPPPTTATLISTKRESAASSAASPARHDDLSQQHQQQQQHHGTTTSSSPSVCDICSSYGHPWIEICKAIRATKGKWYHEAPAEASATMTKTKTRHSVIDDPVSFWISSFLSRLVSRANDGETWETKTYIDSQKARLILLFTLE